MKKTLVYHTLLLLLTAALLLPACERVDPHSETIAGQSLQGRFDGEMGGGIGPNGGGGGPCECGPACSTFYTSLTMPTQIPPNYAAEEYDFVVSLRETVGCNASLLDPSTCRYTHQRFLLSFPNEPHLNNFVDLSYFEKIHAYDTTGDAVQAFEGSTGSSLYVTYETDIYFKWKTQFAGLGTPLQSDLSSGGICIIGILTDPCFPCPDRGRQLHPVVPRRIR
jgi:hypothetical protein